MIDFSRIWLPYIYLYGVGGIFFSVGLWTIIRHRSMNLGLKKHRSWLWILLIGFLWYAMIHATIILMALFG